MSLLGMPLGTSVESCGNYELFLLLATSKDHTADDVGISFSSVFYHLFSMQASACCLSSTKTCCLSLVSVQA